MDKIEEDCNGLQWWFLKTCGLTVIQSLFLFLVTINMV